MADMTSHENALCIGNRMNASAFRDLKGASDVLKVFKIARAVGECNLKNF